MSPSFLFPLLLCLPMFAPAQEDQAEIVYFGKDHYLIEGSAVAEDQKESPFDRLPISLGPVVRPPVWRLSKSSAGLSVRFTTNSPSIHVRWTLLNDTNMNHMADTGIKGVDLYVREGSQWQYVNTGRPTGKENDATLLQDATPETREYRLYLPLYDGIIELEIGIEPGFDMAKGEPSPTKPIVFYGTSITQGGCASRPGMAHTNILSRRLDTECINLGFSGNGRMEKPIAELIARIDAQLYIIECLPNMSAEMVADSTRPLIETLRAMRPPTPIVLVGNSPRADLALNPARAESLAQKNLALRRAFEEAVAEGIPALYLLPTRGALGDDQEGTVDGVHLTDLGFLRYAEFLLDALTERGLVEW